MEENPYASPTGFQSGGKVYSLSVPGFEGCDLRVVGPGFFTGASLLLNGQPVPKDKKGGVFLLRHPDGSEQEARLVTNIVDPLPKVVIAGQTYLLDKPFRWYQYAWAGLPLMLIPIGGALGGLCGALATVINGRIFRSNLQGLVKYLLTGIVFIMAIATYLLMVGIVTLLLRQV